MLEYIKTYFLKTLKTKYFKLGGRADRQEYWFFVLFYYLFYFVLMMVLGLFAAIIGVVASAGLMSERASLIAMIPLLVIFIAFALGLLPPLFAAFVRRLHDTGRSGWWLLLSIVPFGSIVLIIFTILDSQPGPNKYGPNPKGIEAALVTDVFV